MMPQKRNLGLNDTGIVVVENGVTDATIVVDDCSTNAVHDHHNYDFVKENDDSDIQIDKILDHGSNGSLQLTSTCLTLACSEEMQNGDCRENHVKESNYSAKSTSLCDSVPIQSDSASILDSFSVRNSLQVQPECETIDSVCDHHLSSGINSAYSSNEVHNEKSQRISKTLLLEPFGNEKFVDISNSSDLTSSQQQKQEEYPTDQHSEETVPITNDIVNKDSSNKTDIVLRNVIVNPNSNCVKETNYSLEALVNSSERDSRIPAVPPPFRCDTLPDHSEGQQETCSMMGSIEDDNLKNSNCQKQPFEKDRLKGDNAHLIQQHLMSNSDDAISFCETSDDIYEVQMAALENTITQLQREVDTYRDRLAEREEMAKCTLGNVRRDLSMKIEKLTKQLENSERDKEAMVVKYANCEKTVLSMKKVQDELERKLRETSREKDMWMGKVRSLTNERTRLSQTLDNKILEVNALQRDSERLKEEILSKDVKIKWAHNKLKTEADAHKDTLSKLEKTQQKLQQTREEAEQIRRDCQAMIRTYQESEEIKSNSLDLQLKEKESELELERQEKSDQEEVYHMIRSELDALKKKHKLSIDENNALTMKVQSLERERLDYEQNLSKLKEQLNCGQQEIVDLQAKIAEMDNLVSQINREKEKVVMSQTEIERLRQTNADLQIDMEACRRKEGELLEFTERLTSKNVALQSEYSCLEAKFQAQERELARLTKICDESEAKTSSLAAQLIEEQHLRKQETQMLARKLAEKTKACDNAILKLDDQINDNKVLKRKHASMIRELTKELHVLHRRYDLGETRATSADFQGIGSRTSSMGSLDTTSSVPITTSQVNENVGKHNGIPPDPPTNAAVERPLEPTRQMLIERIVKLQRLHARKNEKIEFLEEHVNQMLNEIKKKSKLIQHFIMREEAGALIPISMDKHKMELSRKGGIMASLYTSHQADDGMTIELALEISRKLQAVLEDTLLKNITLKGNIKTLGEEIDRLSWEKRQLQN